MDQVEKYQKQLLEQTENLYRETPISEATKQAGKIKGTYLNFGHCVTNRFVVLMSKVKIRPLRALPLLLFRDKQPDRPHEMLHGDGSRFEIVGIRINQCKSPRLFSRYDKEMANWRSIDDHDKGELGGYPEASRLVS